MCWLSDYNKAYDCTPIEMEKKKGIQSFSDLELVTALVGKKKAPEVLKLLSEKNYAFDNLLTDKDSFKIKASFELGRRFGDHDKILMQTPSDIYSFIKHYAYSDQEHFIVILLDGAHQLIEAKAVTTGILNRTIVHPREVFNYAVEKNACAICVAHNHPSGQLEPSNEDIEVTKRLVSAGRIMGIKVIDHIIFTKYSCRSMLGCGDVAELAY